MALKLDSSKGKINIQCENVISPWNILKYLVDTPYLKSYYIENYEGGNTLVPREFWKEENIIFKEVKGGLLFPYNSINFVLEDSIHNVDVYVVEQDTKAYKSQSEVFFSIRDTEHLSLKIPQEKLIDSIALYLFSIGKIGFDQKMFEGMKEILRKFDFSRIKEIEYIPSSFVLGLMSFSFVIKISRGSNDTELYKIQYNKGKFKIEFLKENQSLNIGVLKKKLMSKNKWFVWLYYGLIAVILLILFIIKKRLVILGLLFFLIIQTAYLLLKKNLHYILGFQNKSKEKTNLDNKKKIKRKK